MLNVVKSIFKAAKRELRLPTNAADGSEAFDTSEHEIYTEEEPNSLDAGEACRWLVPSSRLAIQATRTTMTHPFDGIEALPT